jgi:hypothetical protein
MHSEEHDVGLAPTVVFEGRVYFRQHGVWVDRLTFTKARQGLDVELNNIVIDNNDLRRKCASKDLEDGVLVNFFEAIIDITTEDAAEFSRALHVALQTCSQPHTLYILTDGYVVISFDDTWQPFIGFTFGYNLKPDRLPVQERSRVLESTRVCLQRFSDNKNKPGGRVFINDKGILSYDEMRRRRTWIGVWDWHGTHPQDLVAQMLNFKQSH